MIRYLPADLKTPFDFYESGDVKSPLQLIPFWLAAKASTYFGADTPYEQYRWMLVILGFFHALLTFIAIKRIPNNKSSLTFTTLYILLYFPFLFSITRPMFEALAAPWVLLAGVFAMTYASKDQKNRTAPTTALLLGVVCISVAFALRPQVALCALVFPTLCILQKNWRDLVLSSALGLGIFVILGIFDGILVGGSFHPSLISLITYNVESGSEYGSQPLLTYPLLILAFGFIPWFFFKGSLLFTKNYWVNTFPYWLMIALFVFTHSLFAQKFERFLVPVLPLLALALLPVFQNLWQERRLRPGRTYSLVGLNSLLWFAASWFPAQGNIIDLSLYLKDHPEIKSVAIYKNIPDWVTELFIGHKVQFQEVQTEALKEFCTTDRETRLLVAEGYLDEVLGSEPGFKQEVRISKNPFDHLAYILNPNKNKRRSPLVLLNCLAMN